MTRKFRLVNGINTISEYRLNYTNERGTIILGKTRKVGPDDILITDDEVLQKSILNYEVRKVWSKELEDALIEAGIKYEHSYSKCNCANGHKVVYKPFEEMTED